MRRSDVGLADNVIFKCDVYWTTFLTSFQTININLRPENETLVICFDPVNSAHRKYGDRVRKYAIHVLSELAVILPHGQNRM